MKGDRVGISVGEGEVGDSVVGLTVDEGVEGLGMVGIEGLGMVGDEGVDMVG